MAASGGDNRSWKERMKDKATAVFASKMAGVDVSGEEVAALKRSFKSNDMTEVFANVANLLQRTAHTNPARFNEIFKLAESNGIPKEFRELCDHPDVAAAAILAARGLDQVAQNISSGKKGLDFQDNNASKAKRLTLLSHIVSSILEGVREEDKGVLTNLVSVYGEAANKPHDKMTDLEKQAFKLVDTCVTSVARALADEIGIIAKDTRFTKLSDPVITVKAGHLSVDKEVLNKMLDVDGHEMSVFKYALVEQQQINTSISKRIFEVAGEGPLTRTRENGTTIELTSAKELAPLRQEYAAYKAEVEKATAAKVGHSR